MVSNKPLITTHEELAEALNRLRLTAESQQDIDPEMARLSKNLKTTWGQDGKGYWEANITAESMDPGLYECSHSPSVGWVLVKHSLKFDTLIEFSDPQTQRLYGEFKKFWTLKTKYHTQGFLHKRGYLLWGPPGGGKTSLVNLFMKYMIEELQGVVLNVSGNPQAVTGCMQMLRRLEPHRPVMVLMEDLDALVSNRNEQSYLAVLDGSAAIDGVAFIGTTNYPERLDRRFTNRPNRFDRIELVKMPCRLQRIQYLQGKAPHLSGEELKLWATETKGLSVAHLRELIVNVTCLNLDFADTVKRLKTMNSELPTSVESGKGIGFNKPDDDDDDDDDDEYNEYVSNEPDDDEEAA